MSDMPATRCQRQPVCPRAFPPHSLSTHTYGTIALEGYGIQGFEYLANIANAQYYELEESQYASQMPEESELDAWSRNVNVAPDAREEIAQSKLPRRPSVPMICRLGSSAYRESVAMSAARPMQFLRNLRWYDLQVFQQTIEGSYHHSPNRGIEDLGPCSAIQAIGQVRMACDHRSYILGPPYTSDLSRALLRCSSVDQRRDGAQILYFYVS
jgi:hypothetical protein